MEWSGSVRCCPVSDMGICTYSQHNDKWLYTVISKYGTGYNVKWIQKKTILNRYETREILCPLLVAFHRLCSLTFHSNFSHSGECWWVSSSLTLIGDSSLLSQNGFSSSHLCYGGIPHQSHESTTIHPYASWSTILVSVHVLNGMANPNSNQISSPSRCCGARCRARCVSVAVVACTCGWVSGTAVGCTRGWITRGCGGAAGARRVLREHQPETTQKHKRSQSHVRSDCFLRYRRFFDFERESFNPPRLSSLSSSGDSRINSYVSCNARTHIFPSIKVETADSTRSW